MFAASQRGLSRGSNRVVIVALGVLALLLSAAPARAEDMLHKLNDSVESLAQQVSPAVVQILVTGYGTVDQPGRTDTALISRQRTLGSGVIVDPEGIHRHQCARGARRAEGAGGAVFLGEQ